jgi:hypothetical protein
MTDTWREALELAGLETRSKLGGSKKTSIGATELFERCYAAYGVQPTGREAERFARGQPYPLQPTRPGSGSRRALEALQAQARTRGAGQTSATRPTPRLRQGHRRSTAN